MDYFRNMTIVEKIMQRWRALRYYVIADPTDNSITLSKRLFSHMRKVAGNDASVFVFRIPKNGTFGFMVNHGIGDHAQLCQIQYNGKYRCVGFETLCPSVGRIFYEYGLPALLPAKLSVTVGHTAHGKIFYQISMPSSKLIKSCIASSETQEKPI